MCVMMIINAYHWYMICMHTKTRTLADLGGALSSCGHVPRGHLADDGFGGGACVGKLHRSPDDDSDVASVIALLARATKEFRGLDVRVTSGLDLQIIADSMFRPHLSVLRRG